MSYRFSILPIVYNLKPFKRRSGLVVSITVSHGNGPGSIPGPGIVHLWFCVLLNEVTPRRSDGTLNRGLVCVRMHLRTCADLKEPGWPSESLGVQKQTDRAGMHKRPEDGMWLPNVAGKLKTVTYVYPPLAQGDRKRKKERKYTKPWAGITVSAAQLMRVPHDKHIL